MTVLVDGRVLAGNDFLAAGASHNLRAMLLRGVEVCVAADDTLCVLLENHGLSNDTGLETAERAILSNPRALGRFSTCVTADLEVANLAAGCGVRVLMIGPGRDAVSFGAGAILREL